MDKADRQFMLTTAWLFVRHGRGDRARTLCEALVEADPTDGVAAAALAERLIEDREPEAALKALAAARFPKSLDRAEALLETRALALLGRRTEAERRWKRHCETAKGAARKWA